MHSVQGAKAELEAAGFESNVIVGECRKSVREIGFTPQVEFGVWEGTPGSWRSEWEDWEFFTVLSGKGTLTDGDGRVHALEAGVCVWIPAGSIGLWNLEEPVRKSYVIPVEGAGTRMEGRTDAA